MPYLDHPLLSQAAALLYSIVTQIVPASCPLEQIETILQQLSQEIARQAAERHAASQVAEAEQETPSCACGRRMVAEQRRCRTLLLLFGPIRFPLRRYRCPACGVWGCPAAERLGLSSRRRRCW